MHIWILRPHFVAMYKNKSVGRALHPIDLWKKFCTICCGFSMAWLTRIVVVLFQPLVPSIWDCQLYTYLFFSSHAATWKTSVYVSSKFLILQKSCNYTDDDAYVRWFILSRLMVGIIGVAVIVLITVYSIESSSPKLTFVGVIGDISFISVMIKIPLLSLVKLYLSSTYDQCI